MAAPVWANPVSGKWSIGTNWSTGTVPNGAGQSAIINQATNAALTVTLDEPVTLGTLDLGNSGSASVGYTLSGTGANTLTFDNSGGGATIAVANGSHAINAPVVLNDNLVVSGSGTLLFDSSSSIAGAGYSLTMNGAGGALILAGNTTIGGAAINAGTLQIGNGTTGEYLASPTVTVSNNATLAFSHSDTLTYTGAISGSGQVTEQGGGMLILSGSNTYAGPTTVNGGTLQIGNGASGEYLASPSITLSNNATVEFNHTDTYPNGYSGAISGSGQFVKAGSGSLTLNGANSYTGPTTISAGTLVLGGSDLPTTTALSIAAGAALDMGGNSQTVGSLSGAAGAIIANNLVHPSHTYTSTLTVNPTSGATTFAGNIVDSTLSSSHGNVALTMSGNGELILTGANTYSGGTSVSGGTLEIAAASALPGSGLVTISGGGRLVLGSGSGIGALLAASSPAEFGRGRLERGGVNAGDDRRI